MARNEAADSRHQSDGRNTFEKFTGAVNKQVSRGPFFALVLLLLVIWAVSAPLWHDLKSWQALIHTVSSVLSLVLLVLLENSGRRAEEAAQEKLNVIAESLAALMQAHPDPSSDLQDATRKLSEAVGLEARH